MAEILRVVEPIAHEKFVGRIKSDKLRLVLELGRNVLVKQRANFELAWSSLSEEGHQAVQGPSRIDDVLDEKYVLPLETSLGIVKKSDDSARLHRIAIA